MNRPEGEKRPFIPTAIVSEKISIECSTNHCHLQIHLFNGAGRIGSRHRCLQNWIKGHLPAWLSRSEPISTCIAQFWGIGLTGSRRDSGWGLSSYPICAMRDLKSTPPNDFICSKYPGHYKFWCQYCARKNNISRCWCWCWKSLDWGRGCLTVSQQHPCRDSGWCLSSYR